MKLEQEIKQLREEIKYYSRLSQCWDTIKVDAQRHYWDCQGQITRCQGEINKIQNSLKKRD